MAPITSLDMKTSFGSASSVTSCPLSRAPSSCEERWGTKITQERGPAHNPWTCVNFLRFPDFFFTVSSPENSGLTRGFLGSWALHPGKESSRPSLERVLLAAASPVRQEGACALEERHCLSFSRGTRAAWGHLASLGRHPLSPLAPDHLPVSDSFPPTPPQLHLHQKPPFSQYPSPHTLPLGPHRELQIL